MSEEKLRIGFCGPSEKWERMKWTEFMAYAASKGVDVVCVDLTKPIDKQGPFSVFIHKFTYVMKGHDMTADPGLNSFYKYCKEHPEIPVIDDLDAVAVCLDRYELNDMIQKIKWPENVQVHIPRSLMLEKSETAEQIAQVTKNLRYPILAKPNDCSSAATHLMRLVTSDEQLIGVPTPSHLQEYINHNGVVFKVYALGEHLEVGARPSTRNIQPGESLEVDFDSSRLDDNCLWTKPRDLSHVPLPLEDFKIMSKILRKELKLNLIGFDILIDQENKYWLIDINYFPGYKNIDNLWQKFLDFFREKARK